MLFSLNFQIFGPFSFIRDTSPWITFNFQTPSEFFFCFSYNDHFEDAFKNFFSEALFFDLGMSVLRRSCYQLGRGARARSQAHKHKMRTKAVGHRHSQRGFVCFCYNHCFEEPSAKFFSAALLGHYLCYLCNLWDLFLKRCQILLMQVVVFLHE